MMWTLVICGTEIFIDPRRREICFSDGCVRYRTEKQFGMAYEMLTKIVGYCSEYMHKIEKEGKKNCKKRVKKEEL